MLYEFSHPTKADKVPAGPDWLHEVKYDGYRMMVIREHGSVRLVGRGGYDLMQYFPLIVEAAPCCLPHGPRRHRLEASQPHAYRGGRCTHWVKVKHRAHPTYSRVADLHRAARR